MKALIVFNLLQSSVLFLLLGKIVAIAEELAPAMLDKKITLVSDDFTNTQSRSDSKEEQR